jgi:hypothetical protein
MARAFVCLYFDRDRTTKTVAGMAVVRMFGRIESDAGRIVCLSRRIAALNQGSELVALVFGGQTLCVSHP